MEIATERSKVEGNGRHSKKEQRFKNIREQEEEEKHEKRRDRVRGKKHYTDIWKKGTGKVLIKIKIERKRKKIKGNGGYGKKEERLEYKWTGKDGRLTTPYLSMTQYKTLPPYTPFFPSLNEPSFLHSSSHQPVTKPTTTCKNKTLTTTQNSHKPLQLHPTHLPTPTR